MPTVLSTQYCYDNMMNRVKTVQKLSNNTRMITYKTPIHGGPYSIFSYILNENEYNEHIKCPNLEKYKNNNNCWIK